MEQIPAWFPPTNREPTRAEVIEILDALAQRKVTPQAAEEWALTFLNDQIDFQDPQTWEAVSSLMKADTQYPDGTRMDGPVKQLFGAADFMAWKNKLVG
ncbi:MAG: hypothetical protein QOC71_380 [Thermoplasmata archaeon]|jgi:hypothetical protein|nr:hypothetical protein [Thermoplasmata archaeon]